MSRILDATCVANVVKVEGKVVSPVTILSQGVKSSTGVALLESDKLTYVASNASDISDLISQLSTLVQSISDAFSAFGTAMTGSTTAPPATLSTIISGLASTKAALTTMGNNLK